MPGMDRVEDKKKRAVRRRNHIARDLAKSKYHQRVIPVKGKKYRVRYDDDVDNYRWEEDND